MPLGAASGAVYGLDDAQTMRHAEADLLSLALMDARNVSLRWLAVLEELKLEATPTQRAAADGPTQRAAAGGPTPLWLIGHAGWYQEYMVARHVRRAQGAAADASSTRLASIQPQADAWFAGGVPPPGGAEPLLAESVRSYLVATLETTLELLPSAGGSDDALFNYRAALLHEDRIANALAEAALVAQWPLAQAPQPVRAERDALWMPAQTVMLGSPQAAGGFVPENERWAHAVAVPEFEIDAQAVNWAQFVPFAEDGGYDQRSLWTDAGWAWQQATERRAPRHVEQLRGGAVLMRQGRLVRAPGAQAVLHVSRHEAEAWCRWAGRRLPTEPEWELAAKTARSRGFVWGDVFEWVGGSARAWPGHEATPDGLDALARCGRPSEVGGFVSAADGTGRAGAAMGVLRGASWLCRGRLHHPSGRRFLAVGDDSAAVGFRSCAA